MYTVLLVIMQISVKTKLRELGYDNEDWDFSNDRKRLHDWQGEHEKKWNILVHQKRELTARSEC